MMRFFRNPHVLMALASSLLFNCVTEQLFAVEPEETNQEQHIKVGSRPMDQEKCNKIEEQKLERAYESDSFSLPSSALQNLITRGSFTVNTQPTFHLAPSTYTNPHCLLANFPLSCHWLTAKNSDSRCIKIEDGSSWEIAPSDYHVVTSWRSNDPLFITPITSWFISQHYYIINRTNNSYVKANLVDGPTAFGPFSNWVNGIDLVQGLIFLQNQSVWSVDPNDLYILTDRKNNNEWAPNDHIIIILHDNKYSSYDHILINVNMNNQVHVKPYL